jgi:hypothetical protein
VLPDRHSRPTALKSSPAIVSLAQGMRPLLVSDTFWED